MPSRARDSTSDEKNDVISQPIWDTDIANLPAHMRSLEEWLPTCNSKYRTWIRNNTIIERGQIYFLNVNHMDRYQNHVISEGTFASPCGLTRTSYVAFSPAAGGIALGTVGANHCCLPEKGEELDQTFFDKSCYFVLGKVKLLIDWRTRLHSNGK